MNSFGKLKVLDTGTREYQSREHYREKHFKITAISHNEAKKPVSGEYGLATVPEYEAKTEDNQSNEMQLTIDSLKDAFASTSEGIAKTPVSTHTRDSHLKQPKIGKRFQDSEFTSSQGEDEKTAQTSPAASINKLESTVCASESSEDFLEENPEQRATDFEDERDKNARPTPETQPHLEKQDACKQYFEKYPGDHELLWEVEGVGHWYQRIPVTRALQRETLKITAISHNEAKRPVSGEYGLATVPEYEAETEDNQSNEMQLTVGALYDHCRK
ncbi:UPF0611 protein FAM169A [Heterocephalus glaber]|uniref:UPF0611 protein FAM169A n=1 Tax=Heterocephalus glaber TaxID=10181 RepID=G5B1R0_HETGA|nr:UPF0611 protein FAM169A [Heterocephalus glaber]